MKKRDQPIMPKSAISLLGNPRRELMISGSETSDSSDSSDSAKEAVEAPRDTTDYSVKVDIFYNTSSFP